jgi:hypothetical protein
MNVLFQILTLSKILKRLGLAADAKEKEASNSHLH